VGLATVTDPPPELMQLRLQTKPDLVPGDNVLLTGLDRLTGTSRVILAAADRRLPYPNTVLLRLQGEQSAFALRPEDTSASVLFVRGSALALIQKYNLFVSWLACGEPDSRVTTCVGATVRDCPCAQSEEQS